MVADSDGTSCSASDSASDTAREALYLALSSVPAGRLISYGDLAELAGLPGRARWVGRQLSQLPASSQLPWHRVLKANGRLAFQAGSEAYRRQLSKLQAEGSADDAGHIHWRACRWPDK